MYAAGKSELVQKYIEYTSAEAAHASTPLILNQ